MSDSRAPKTCLHCRLPFTWRKKWAAVWDRVEVCSDRCRRARKRTAASALEQAILVLLQARTRGATICPSEAARAVDEQGWRQLMEEVRCAARRLEAKGLVEVLQRGRRVDSTTARGPIRLRLSGR